jgi:hypothetical protein
MPNTLAHIGLQGLATRRLFRDADYKWIYVGCIIPDLPWIYQRLIKYFIPDIDFYDLRLYAIVQASLLLCLLFSLALATISKHYWRTLVILSSNSLLHLVLDASQIKWANGVLFFAPLSWQLTGFDLFWPESIPTYTLTVFGLFCLALSWRKSIALNSGFILRSGLRISILIFFASAYFIVPFFLLHGPEDADNHYVKTLRTVKSRPGSYVEFDRAGYTPTDSGGVLKTYAGEEISIKGIKLLHSAKMSVRGRFIDSNSVQVYDFHIHSDLFRDAASYAGLGLIAMVWIVFLIRKRKCRVDMPR